MSNVILPILLVSLAVGSTPSYTQTPTCQQAFTLGPDQILCYPEIQTQVNLQTTWELLSLDWIVSPNPVYIDSLTWSVTTSGTETLIASAEIRSPNMIVNGDFSAGNTGFTSTMLSSPFTLIIPGSYAIVNDPSTIHPDFKPCQDHTSGTGPMLACNGSLLANRDIWCQNVQVDPGGVYDLSFWASALTENESPELVFRLDGQNLGTFNVLGPVTCDWMETQLTWIAGLQSTVQVCIRNLNGSNSGNDFALDDIVMQERCMVSDTLQVRHIPKKESSIDTLLCEGTSMIVGGQLIQQPGIDTILVTDDWGCDSMIVVDAQFWNPDLTIAVSDTLTCDRDIVTLTSSVQPGPGVLTFSWIDPAGNPISGGSSSALDVQLPGIYTLSVVLTSSLGTCTATADHVVIQDITTPAADAGIDAVLTCLSDSVILQAMPNTSNTVSSWTWLTDPGQPQTPGPTLVVRDSGIYLLTVINQMNGCSNRDSIKIEDQRVLPSGLQYTLQGPVCEGGNGLLEVQGLTVGQSPFDILLIGSNGDQWTSSMIQGLESGDYMLLVTDANGCEWDTLLTLPQVVVPEFQLPDGLTARAGELVPVKPAFNFSDSLITSYSWSSNTLLLDCQTCSIVDVSGLDGGILSLCIRLGEDCEICDQTYISFDETWFSFQPTAFSPNEDGVNDLFRLILNPDVVIQMESLAIFDRWGNQVYLWMGTSGGSPTGGWDGNVGGDLAPSGVYVFSCHIRLITGQEKIVEGEVQLIR